VFDIPIRGANVPPESKVPISQSSFFDGDRELKPCWRVQDGFTGAWDMARADEYRRYAAECLRVAQKTNNPSDKAMMLEMAQRWLELAERSERESDTKKKLQKALHARAKA